MESIQEHSNERYVDLISRSMLSMVSFLAFEYLIFLCDIFKKPRIDFHAPYEIQGMGTEWSEGSQQLVLEP